MVYFITGSVGAGKSTRLYTIYRILKNGDGFYNVRQFSGDISIGQDLIQMSTAKCMPFGRIDGFLPEGWQEEQRYHNYSFSKHGLQFAEDIINSTIEKQTAVYLDELGPLELEGKGLAAGFTKLLNTNQDIYAVCRATCLEEIIKKFNVKEYRII